jgi:tetratricopeptide (TPR) repeat protein
LLRRGRIADVRLTDREAALEAYTRALAEPLASLDTTTDALDALMGLGSTASQLERVREVLDERLAHAVEPAERAGLLVLRARLWQTSFGHVGRARADLEAAIKTTPGHGPAHLLLARLADERDDTLQAADHFDRALRAREPAPLSANQMEDAFAGFVRAERRLDRGLDVVARARSILTRHPECRAARAVIDSRGPS